MQFRDTVSLKSKVLLLFFQTEWIKESVKERKVLKKARYHNFGFCIFFDI